MGNGAVAARRKGVPSSLLIRPQASIYEGLSAAGAEEKGPHHTREKISHG